MRSQSKGEKLDTEKTIANEIKCLVEVYDARFYVFSIVHGLAGSVQNAWKISNTWASSKETMISVMP